MCAIRGYNPLYNPGQELGVESSLTMEAMERLPVFPTCNLVLIVSRGWVKIEAATAALTAEVTCVIPCLATNGMDFIASFFRTYGSGSPYTLNKSLHPAYVAHQMLPAGSDVKRDNPNPLYKPIQPSAFIIDFVTCMAVPLSLNADSSITMSFCEMTSIGTTISCDDTAANPPATPPAKLVTSGSRLCICLSYASKGDGGFSMNCLTWTSTNSRELSNVLI